MALPAGGAAKGVGGIFPCWKAAALRELMVLEYISEYKMQ